MLETTKDKVLVISESAIIGGYLYYFFKDCYYLPIRAAGETGLPKIWQDIEKKYPNIPTERMKLIRNFASVFDFSSCPASAQREILQGFVETCEKHPFIEEQMREFLRLRPADMDRTIVRIGRILEEGLSTAGTMDWMNNILMTKHPKNSAVFFHENQHNLQGIRKWEEGIYGRFLMEADAKAVDALMSKGGSSPFFKYAKSYRLDHPEKYEEFLRSRNIPLSEAHLPRHQQLYEETLGHNLVRKFLLEGNTQKRLAFCRELGIPLAAVQSFLDTTFWDKFYANWHKSLVSPDMNDLLHNTALVDEINAMLTAQSGVPTDIRSAKEHVERSLLMAAKTEPGLLEEIMSREAIRNGDTFYYRDIQTGERHLITTATQEVTNGKRVLARAGDYIDIADDGSKRPIRFLTAEEMKRFEFCDMQGRALPKGASPIRVANPIKLADEKGPLFSREQHAILKSIIQDLGENVTRREILWTRLAEAGEEINGIVAKEGDVLISDRSGSRLVSEQEFKERYQLLPDTQTRGNLSGCYEITGSRCCNYYKVKEDIFSFDGKKLYSAGDYVLHHAGNPLSPTASTCISEADFERDFIPCDSHGFISPEHKAAYEASGLKAATPKELMEARSGERIWVERPGEITPTRHPYDYLNADVYSDGKLLYPKGSYVDFYPYQWGETNIDCLTLEEIQEKYIICSDPYKAQSVAPKDNSTSSKQKNTTQPDDAKEVAQTITETKEATKTITETKEAAKTVTETKEAAKTVTETKESVEKVADVTKATKALGTLKKVGVAITKDSVYGAMLGAAISPKDSSEFTDDVVHARFGKIYDETVEGFVQMKDLAVKAWDNPEKAWNATKELVGMGVDKTEAYYDSHTAGEIAADTALLVPKAIANIGETGANTLFSVTDVATKGIASVGDVITDDNTQVIAGNTSRNKFNSNPLEYLSNLVVSVDRTSGLRSDDNMITLAESGRIKALQEYIKDKIDINETDERGYTALHIAAERGDWETMKILLADPRIDANAKAKYDNRTPLMVALDTAGNEPTAAQKQVLALMRKSHKTDMNAVDANGKNIWLHAVAAGNMDYARSIAKQVDTQKQDNSGRNAIHYCLAKPAEMKQLLAMGVDPTVLDENGHSALEKAMALKENDSVIHILAKASHPQQNRMHTFAGDNITNKPDQEENMLAYVDERHSRR